MKKWLFIIILILFASLFGWLAKKPASQTPNYPVLKVGDIMLSVEIADTDEKRAQGLSGRLSLPENHGMLFVMEKNSQPTFWMKEMRFSIDILWLNDDSVVDITQNVPAPSEGTPPNNLARYSPRQPASYVLEVNAGFAESRGISVGTAIQLPNELQ